MTSFILLLFYLVTSARSTNICALWLSQAASLEDVSAACGEINLEEYEVNFVNLQDGTVACAANATAVYHPAAACTLSEPLDHFRMEVYEPAKFDAVLCSVTSLNNPPTRDEIAAACDFPALQAYDQGQAELRYMGEAPQPPPVNVVTFPKPENGPGLYDQPASAAELATREQLTWLAGRLIWIGQVKAICPGGRSGLDPVTLVANPCGQSAATRLVNDWQNQFDAEIYAAALEEDVPARLLKRILRVETQFWPLWGARPFGEIGMAQITHAGADQYLRWYQPGYGYLSLEQQAQFQSDFLKSLACDNCDLEAAIQKERTNIVIYARILRAYRLATESWEAALTLWNGGDYAERIQQGG